MAGTTRYGWRTDDIDAVAGIIQTALGIEFEARESLYLGEYYSWPRVEQMDELRAELSLQRNFFDEIDEELAYPEHPKHGVLLHASSVPDDWAEQILALPGTEILRQPLM